MTSQEMDSLKKISPKQFIEHQSIKIQDREVHIIVVSGTYYDMGLNLGRELGQLLQSNITAGYESIKRKISLFLNKAHNIDDDLNQALKNFTPQVPKVCRMEMLGVNDGCREAGYPLKDVDMIEKMSTTIELGEQECTLFAMQPPMTTGHTYHLRDLDFYKNIKMDYVPAIIIRIPQDEHGHLIDSAYASFDFLANIVGGVITGINEHGIAFSQSRGPFPKRFSFQGTPIKYLIQQILSKATSTSHAIDIIKHQPPSTSHFAIVSDPEQKKESLKLLFMGPGLLQHTDYDTCPDLSIIQYEDENLRFYKPIPGIVYWTDMVDRKVNGVPIEFNMPDLYPLLKNYEHQMDAEKGLEIAKVAGNDVTFISALFDSTTREVWVAYSTRRSPAHNQEFLHLDLKKYFNYKDRLI